MLTTMSWSDRQEVEIGDDDRVQTSLKFVRGLQTCVVLVGCIVGHHVSSLDMNLLGYSSHNYWCGILPTVGGPSKPSLTLK